MAKKERKFVSSETIGSLELKCEAQEQLHGEIVSLEIVGDYTVAGYDSGEDRTRYPAVSTLALFPVIGDVTAPAPAGTTLLFTGEALILGTRMQMAVFRTG